MDNKKIVENIQRICKERGTTPTVAGEKSGAGKSLVSQLKTRGIMPSIEKFQMLAEYLGVTTSELLGEEKPTPVSGDGQIGPAKKALLDMMEDMNESELLALAELVKATKKMRSTE